MFSRFSINIQILSSLLPVLIVLIIIAYTSINQFSKTKTDFQILSNVKKEGALFKDIENGMLHLQRNVLVYSYVGYEGVTKKIEYINQQLESSFNEVRPIAQRDAEIFDRLKRLEKHFNDYQAGFSEAVKEKKTLKEIKNDKISPIQNQIRQKIEELLRSRENLRPESINKLVKVQTNLSMAEKEIILFQASPDATHILRAQSFIAESIEEISSVRQELQAPLLTDIKNDLRTYENAFIEYITINRVYLHLINVVLAGKAAEIDSLLKELDTLINERTLSINKSIFASIEDTKEGFIFLLLIAGTLGTVSALLIAINISRPVNQMTQTLTALSEGNSDVDIPGRSRKDEVGAMARAAQKFRIMAENLEEKSTELEEFAYRTSHDLRSPLVSSIGLLNVSMEALDKDNPDQAKQALMLVQTSLEKLETLVKDILALTHAKNAEEDVQEVDINVLVDEAISKFEYMQNYDRLRIQKNLKVTSNLQVQKSRLVLILENLLSNAIKYQDLQKSESFIQISAEDNGKQFVLTVEDNGLGIPEENADEVFNMFKRFHPKVSFGSGLGLYMMKKSADILGGYITYKNTGEGSIFTLEIPKNRSI